MKRPQYGFTIVEGLLITIIIVILGGTGWYVWSAQDKATKNLNAADLSNAVDTTDHKLQTQKNQTTTETKKASPPSSANPPSAPKSPSCLNTTKDNNYHYCELKFSGNQELTIRFAPTGHDYSEPILWFTNSYATCSKSTDCKVVVDSEGYPEDYSPPDGNYYSRGLDQIKIMVNAPTSLKLTAQNYVRASHCGIGGAYCQAQEQFSFTGYGFTDANHMTYNYKYQYTHQYQGPCVP